MRRLRALVLPALLSAAACAPSGKPGTLEDVLRRVPGSPLCSQNLPSDWVSTWPVPTGSLGGSEFEILFYALDRTAEDASGMPRVRVTEPRGRAFFTLDGRTTVCEATDEEAKPLEGERYPDAAMRMEEEQFDKAQTRLLSLTEQAAKQFAGKAAVDKKALVDFADQFDVMAEPALSADYYKAQPRFWDWLSQQLGKKLPAGR